MGLPSARIQRDAQVKRFLAQRTFGSLEFARDFHGWHFGFGERLEFANVLPGPGSALDCFFRHVRFRFDSQMVCSTTLTRIAPMDSGWSRRRSNSRFFDSVKRHNCTVWPKRAK